MPKPRLIATARVYAFAGSELRALREARGLTPEALGEMVGLSDQSIRNFESGRKAPNATKLARLASVFGVSPDRFFIARTVE